MPKISQKIDPNYVIKNRLQIKEKSIKNAKEMLSEAIILRKHGKFCRALFLIITSLEELAKASLVVNIDSRIPDSFNTLVDHKMKLDEIVKLVNKTYKTNIKKEDIIWARNNRLLEMREDVIYTRLKPKLKKDGKEDNEYPMFPKNGYWQKRAKSFLKKLENIIKYL